MINLHENENKVYGGRDGKGDGFEQFHACKIR